MTREQKISWAAKAPDDHLRRMLKSLIKTNFFGQNAEGIDIVKAEIERRNNNERNS
jgi:hypothetical protein